MQLTKQQIAHFRTFGFLIRRQVFPPQEMAEIIAAEEENWRPPKKTGKNAAGYGSESQFIERNPRLAYLADDDRIYEPVRQLLGDGFIWGGSEGQRRGVSEGEDHYWHADRSAMNGADYGCIKHMIYLEPTTKETGALRIVPGSHLPAFAELLDPLSEGNPDTVRGLFGVEGDELPCVALESEPGDLVMFNHYLFHGVYHKRAVRRYIAIKFAEKPRKPEHFELLCKHGQETSKLHERFRDSERPRIREMTENLL